jgi:predicted SprT family Zn-dependent metalloprotease
MEDELKKNLIALFVKRGHKGKEIVEEVKEILSLIDEERCVWTEKTRSNGVIVYKTSCDKQAITWERKNFNDNPFCQACGKRIEVKEVEDGQ